MGIFDERSQQNHTFFLLGTDIMDTVFKTCHETIYIYIYIYVYRLGNV